MSDIFLQLDNFTPYENWGDASKVNGTLLLLLQEIRAYVGKSFVIHNAYEKGGHSEKSQHYIGNAVDFHIEGISFLNAIEEIEEAIRFYQVEDHIGLGIYPDWYNPGFHLDVRGTKARWGRVGSTYVSYENAKQYAYDKTLI